MRRHDFGLGAARRHRVRRHGARLHAARRHGVVARGYLLAPAVAMAAVLVVAVASSAPSEAAGGATASPLAAASAVAASRSAAYLARRHDALAGVSPHRARLEPDEALPQPSWWDGPCDDRVNGISFPLKAEFDGLQACGPGSDQSGEDFAVNFFNGAWGEYEWECVELAMRWMYLAWGVHPYGADGDSVVANYPNDRRGYPRLSVVRNGTPGRPPQPGDVISMYDGDGSGHAEVVASSSVDPHGNGFVTAITQNNGSSSNGWDRLSVSHWVVSDIDGPVIGWLHNPNWTLDQPVLWDVTAAGRLQIDDSGGLGGSFATVATHIASAEVVGGDGYSPAPIVVALTAAGELVGGYYLPGLRNKWLGPIAAGVRSFSLSARPGPSGRPVLAWVTTAGNLEVAAGGLRRPVKEATGATAVDVAAGSGPGDAFIGYLSSGGTFYARLGPAVPRKARPWSQVATGVSAIALGGGSRPPSDVVEAYTSHGTFYAREGLGAAFTEEARYVAAIAVTTVGAGATPLLAYLSAGRLEVRLGLASERGFSLQATRVTAISVSASESPAGFSIIAAVVRGHFEAKDGGLNGRWTSEPRHVRTAGVAVLTVS